MAICQEPEIVVGTLVSPHTIKAQGEHRNIEEWDYRAMWSFLRLQCGRSIDQQIRGFIEEQGLERYQLPYEKLGRDTRAELMTEFFNSKLDSLKKQRKLQFIVDNFGDVRAVASLKHLLVPPRQVYVLAQQIVETQHPELKPAGDAGNGYEGLTFELAELGGFKFGLQLYGGDIFTRRAITLSSWLRVMMCFNPLSWLGSGSFHSLLGNGKDNHERMLRIKVANELQPRLEQAIKVQVDKTKSIQKRVEVAKKVAAKRSDAEIIMAAFGLSYNLGVSTVEQILQRLEKEKETQWGMAMASSWVAEHGEHKGKGDPDSKVVQKLSTISGAALLIDDIPKVREKSEAWLQAHVKGGGKALEELARKLKVELK